MQNSWRFALVVLLRTETAVEETEASSRSTREQEIRICAYEIYLQRGEQPGSELEDWLQAERELTS